MARGAALSVIGMYNWDDTLFDGMAYPDGFTSDDKEIFKNNLLMDCAELEVLYSDWDFLRFSIINWSAKELPTWQRIYDASLLEYNPIENYNRTETTTETHSGSIRHTGTDSVQASGKDTNQASGKDTNQASGSDIDALLETDSVTNSGSDTDTLSRTSFENSTFAAAEKSVHERGTSESVSKSSNNNHTHGRKDELSYGKKDELSYGKRDETTYGHTITDTTGKTITGNIAGNIGVTTSQQMLEQEMEIAPKLNVINYMIESFKNRFCLLVY